MSRFVVLPALAAAAAVVAGCGGGEEPRSAPTTAPPPPPPTCASEGDGFRVEYPRGWWASGGGVARPCRFFHPEPLELEPATEPPPIAVRVAREPVPLERVIAGGPSREDLLREELRLAGRRAVRIEREASGDALLPAGTRTYQVALDLGEETLVFVTSDREGLDYERNREVVDRMAASVELLG